MHPKFAHPPGCAECTLNEKGFGFVPPEGPPSAPIVFIGESAGTQEAIAGSPFVGAAGGMLERIFKRSHLSRDIVRVANCISCQPPGDWLEGAPWQYSALAHCRQYLDPVINTESHTVIVTLGAVPLRSILDLWGEAGIRVQDFHGTVHQYHRPDGRVSWVVPTFHPSHLQRGAINLLDVVRHDIGVAVGLAKSGGTWNPRAVSLLLDPPPYAFALWITTFLQRLKNDPEGIWLSADLETPDKAGGRDEGELTTDDVSTVIERINFSYEGDEGITVPYEGPYIELIDKLLAGAGIVMMWNKGYDEPRILLAQHKRIGREIWDLMWAAHHLQSDLPLGLGFWAPFYSDYGAWKHLGKIKGKEAEYAAVDGFQTTRVGHGIVKDLVEAGMWEAFYRHTHLREQWILRPAHDIGLLVDVPQLDAFHTKLQGHSATLLTKISGYEAAGSLKPKFGYRERPKGDPPIPPVSIIGKHKEKGDDAKAEYFKEGIQLVQKEIAVPIQVCRTCGKSNGVGPKHRCAHSGGRTGSPELTEIPQNPEIVTETRRELRWFWKLPFNPDAHQQVLKYIKDTGQQPGKAKKTRKDTSNKETLRRLAKKTGDPIYTDILDYKAVKKVDSTYALGAKRRIWADGRLHPQWTGRPSTHRDSYVSPNIQNVCTDRGGPTSLASGFRDCVVASPGCKILEVDYSGIEAVETGWLCGDPNYIRLAYLGIHAYLAAHLIKKPADLSWSDADLAAYFAEIKQAYPEVYDKAKRCLTGDHCVLTPEGWVRLDQYQEGTPVAQWTPDRILEFAPASLTVLPFTGEMVALEGRSLSAVMTPDHRVPLWRADRTIGVRRAGDLPSQGRIPCSGELEVRGAEQIDHQFLRLIVAVQADGTVGRSGVVFHLHKQRKIDRLITLLIDTHTSYTDVPCGHGGRRIRIAAADADQLLAWLEGTEKLFHLPAFLRLSIGCRTVVVEELQHWDGHIRKAGGYTYYTTHRMQAERVQTLAATIDRQALLRTIPVSSNRLGTSSMYRVTFNTRHDARIEACNKTTIPYDGLVYCLTVPSSYFLVKYRDRISVTGNCVHGNAYGLTIHGMLENFPEVYSDLKDAQRVQDLYYAVAPKLPEFHARMRDRAYEFGRLGGPPSDDYYQLVSSGQHHPYAYRHWFWGVQSFRPMTEKEYRAAVFASKKRGEAKPRGVVILNMRPFKVNLGEDSKRCIAFYPQSIAAGRLKEAELELFHPDSPDYIGDRYFGRSPLRAPIHDSLLMEVPDRELDYVLEQVVTVMRRPEYRQPCPPEWGIGDYLRVGVSAKVGRNWGHMEKVKLPEMMPETATEQMFSPVEVDQWEDVLDLGTVIQ